MKKLIFTLLISLVAFPQLIVGEELWADINFTRDSVIWQKDASTPIINTNELYDNLSFSDGVNTYSVHGYMGKFGQNWNKINFENEEETFIVGFQLSRSTSNHLTFPKFDNIGRIKIHIYNKNKTNYGNLPLKWYDEASESWKSFDPEIKFYLPVDDSRPTTQLIDTILNLGPTQLQLGSILKPGDQKNAPNVQVYAVQIFKKDLVDNTVNPQSTDLHFNLTGRTLKITGVTSNYHATVFNLAGICTGQFSNKDHFTFQDPGIYIIRVESKVGTVAKKVVVY